MDFLPVYSSSFDLCVGRTNANYLAGYEMDRVGMRERIENTSKESLTAKTEKNNPTFTKSDLLEGRITHEKAPDDLDDAYDSTVSESDCVSENDYVNESDEETIYADDLDDLLEATPYTPFYNQAEAPTNWTKVKSIIAIIGSFAPIVIGVGIFQSGAMAGNSSLINLGSQLTVGGVALLTCSTLCLRIIDEEEDLVGYDEID